MFNSLIYQEAHSSKDRSTIEGQKNYYRYVIPRFSLLDNDWEVFHMYNHTQACSCYLLVFRRFEESMQTRSGSRLLSSRRFLVSADGTPCLRTENKL